ncbi:hypothetical protein RKD37_004944 [Streptomyces ambofaciens]
MFLVGSPGTSFTYEASEQSYDAADGIASAGSHTSRSPSPSPSMPWVAHVPGMNCAIPCAAAALRAFGLNPLSWYNWAASSAGLMAGQRLPHFCTIGWYAAGTLPLASFLAPPPAPPAGFPPTRYTPTTSSITKPIPRATATPAPTHILRMVQPSPMGARFSDVSRPCRTT